MKIIINENQYNLIKESINPLEANNVIKSIETIIKGKRCVSFIVSLSSNEKFFVAKMIKKHHLSSLKVPSNPHGAWIIYKPECEESAIKLRDIAEVYDGYLDSHDADDDTREIGRILNYDRDSVEEFINKMNKQRKNNEYS